MATKPKQAKPDDPPERVMVRRKAVRKDHHILIRVTAEQKQTLTDAALRAGLGLSSWLLMHGLRAAHDAPKG